MDNTGSKVFLGAPIFGNDPRLGYLAPQGQERLFWGIRKETNDPKKILYQLSMEYGAILSALMKMGIKFQVIMVYQWMMLPGMADFFEKVQIKISKFPELDSRVLAFPRDLAVTLPNGTVLVNSDLPLSKKMKKYKSVIHSPLGEGGRIHIRGNKAIIPERLYPEKGFIIDGIASDIKPLQKSHLQIVVLPNALFSIDAGDFRAVGVKPDDHQDRVSGLLEGKDGKLHLVVNPEIHSEGQSLARRVAIGSKDTLKIYGDLCQSAGIELHVPDKITVPYSTGFWQAKNGKVLVTSGDDEIAGIVEKIIEKENVFYTHIPICYLPVWSKAGIRCLIGEFPGWVRDLWWNC